MSEEVRYIVASQVGVPGHQNCILAKEDDLIIATHAVVFGPDTKQACERWMADNCSK